MSDNSTSDIINLYKPKKRFHIPKKLYKLFKNTEFTFKMNSDFVNVISKCQNVKRRENGTWINKIILDTYINLYHQVSRYRLVNILV